MPLILILPLIVASVSFAGCALWAQRMFLEACVLAVLGIATVAAMVGL